LVIRGGYSSRTSILALLGNKEGDTYTRKSILALFGNKEGDILPARTSTSILALFGNKEGDILPEKAYWHCLVIKRGIFFQNKYTGIAW
jgi:hypothetical protein